MDTYQTLMDGIYGVQAETMRAPDRLYVGDMVALRRYMERHQLMVNDPKVKADTFAGISLYEDRNLPADVAELRTADGKVLKRIADIG